MVSVSLQRGQTCHSFSLCLGTCNEEPVLRIDNSRLDRFCSGYAYP